MNFGASVTLTSNTPAATLAVHQLLKQGFPVDQVETPNNFVGSVIIGQTMHDDCHVKKELSTRGVPFAQSAFSLEAGLNRGLLQVSPTSSVNKEDDEQPQPSLRANLSNPATQQLLQAMTALLPGAPTTQINALPVEQKASVVISPQNTPLPPLRPQDQAERTSLLINA